MISNLQEGDKLYIKKWDLEYIIGVDEVGRGTLAGPVVAIAIAIPVDSISDIIWQQSPLKYTQDSKKVTPKRRQAIYESIPNQYTIGLGVISSNLIDIANILEATKLAWLESLQQCVEKLPLGAKIGILIDGNIVPEGLLYPNQAIIKGDNKHLSIALASIYAKVYRDNLMTQYNIQYPQYGFAKHKGYGTPEHIKAIKQYGLSDIHRTTFCKNII